MDIFNDFDRWQVALKKIDLHEDALPYVNGKLLTENVDVYAKIQKLLNCRSMECCHPFLYSLDVEILDESEINKVNNLYKLGCEKGFIKDDEEKQETTDECNICGDPNCTDPMSHVDVTPAAQVPAVAVPAPAPAPAPVQTSAFTVMYSAMKDGQIKTGEAYSNSINTRSAKADVISKLEKAGYSSITILAIEAGDPDMAGCDNTFCAQPTVLPTIEAEEELDEADDKKEEKSDDKSDDSDEEADDKEDDKKEEKTEEPDEKLKDDKEDSEDTEDADSDSKDSEDSDKKELSAADKTNLKDGYKKAFKAAMAKCKYFDKSFEDLSLDEKVKFFTELSKAWGSKADPSEFMSDKEVDQLEKIIVKK